MEQNYGEKTYTVQRDSGDRLDAAAKSIARRDGVSYRDALVKASKELPQLFQAWDSGVRTVKNFDKLSASEREMVSLQNDPDRVKFLAGNILDHHAKLLAGGPNSSAG